MSLNQSFDVHPMTAICSWIGNSKPVAAKHYLKVTAEDFAKALDDDMVIQRVMHDTEQPCAVVIEDILNTQNTAMLADAQLCLSSKTTQYAQQESYKGKETPLIIDSTEMECESECDRLENIEHIENLLHTFDADYVQLLLEVIEDDS
jgi:hypothetical protein